LRYSPAILLLILFVGFVFQFGRSQDLFLYNDRYFDDVVAYMPDSIDLPFPIQDRFINSFETPPQKNTLDLKDPTSIKKQITYDPNSRNYIIEERIGNSFYRSPTYMTFEEYIQMQQKQSMQNYFDQRTRALDYAVRDSRVPDRYMGPELFNRAFGGMKIDIQPRGTVDVTVGVISTKIDNPTLRVNQRKNTNFDFDMNINLNLTGQIGDKMKMGVNFNTQTTFNFENEIKLGYEGKEDDIIQLIEAGNVNFPLRSSLIRGSQSLFGIKTKLKFGRLTITNVLSQQKSQAQNIRVENGAQTRLFDIKADEYEDNRHFFLAHYFRDNYERNLELIPVINSQAVINRVEVWVTNKNRQTENIREVLALMDLGENEKLSNPLYASPGATRFADNNSNRLYREVINGGDKLRNPALTSNFVANELQLQPVSEFERTSARQLNPQEYTLNERLGYISLNQRLRPDEVLAIALEYTVNGRLYKVGEFSTDLPPSVDTTRTVDRVMVLKMLKSTGVRTRLPIWDLMMKNVYNLEAFQISNEDFILDVFYRDPGGGRKRYLPEGGAISGEQLLQVLGLDRLNFQQDPQPDGRFDFVEGVTINSRNGRIYFPVLEPFGSNLRAAINNDAIADKYVYQVLYDSTVIVAKQFPEKNRFSIEGRYKSSVSSEIRLNAFNVPQGSIVVSAGGRELMENIHYTVNYGAGTVQVIDEGILNSGTPIDIRFENNTLFGVVNRSLIGTRLDYWINDKLSIGATQMRLSERPFTPKVNIGEDPVRNSIYGFDINYETTSPGLTRAMSSISFSENKAPSRIAAYGEMARFKPGHAKAIKQDQAGTVYVDDFEGSNIRFDLKFPLTAWQLSSTPRGMVNEFGVEMFPESKLFNDLSYGFNRAKMAWYQVDGQFYNFGSAANNPLSSNRVELEGLYTRLYFERQIFPNRDNPNLTNPPIFTFDLAYFPEERGPYNFETKGVPGISAGLDFDGKLRDPESRWAGISRYINVNNFEESNIEFIEFWMLDPFLESNGERKGKMLIHLGSVSEDILKDSRKQYENGLPRPSGLTRVDTTAWGVVPAVTNALTNSFDASETVIVAQDIGLDGLNDDAERDFHRQFLDDLRTTVNADVFDSFLNDPSGDNYIFPLDPNAFGINDGIVTRYKDFNGPEGNSSYNARFGGIINGNSKNNPDDEDLNQDNTLNETEEYFVYELDFSPFEFNNSSYVRDIRRFPVSVAGTPDTAVWYQIKIPVDEFTQRVGNIEDFRSIQYIRMVLTGFEEPVVVRMAEFGLIRNQWRRYNFSLKQPGESLPDDNFGVTNFTVTGVSVEENSSRQPIPYAIPPGIAREIAIGGTQNAFLNEQALSMQICELEDGDSRAIFRWANLDLRRFKRLRLFSHAEEFAERFSSILPLKDNDLNLFIRLGFDFTENFYEYELPLKVTPPGAYNPENENDKRAIWPLENEINVLLDSLTKVKQLRNNQNFSPLQPFKYTDEKGHTYTVQGNPDLGQSTIIMLGVRNPRKGNNANDDGLPKCAEVWVNELRLSGFDEEGGWAALGRVDIQLSDIGNITFSGNMHTVGFGGIDQRLEERFLDNYYQYDVAANLELGKFIPPKAGLQIPLYANYSQTISTPKYDPYELDITVKDRVESISADPNLSTAEKRERINRIKSDAQTVTTVKSINLSNVRKNKTDPEKPARVYDIENFNFSYAYNEIDRKDPTIDFENTKTHSGSMGWNYSLRPKYIQPLKAMINNHKYLKPFKELNFNPYPSVMSFRTEIRRKFGERKIKDITDDGFELPSTFDKDFVWNRMFNYRHSITRSITLDYAFNTNTRIDEPPGRLDTREDRDSLRRSFWNFGRKLVYNSTFNANYNLPLKLIPAMDWINTRVSYGSGLDYEAASLVAPQLGNVVSNSQKIQINGELDFKNLYNKWAFLKPYNAVGKTSNKEGYEQSKERVKKKKEEIQKRWDKKKDDLEKVKDDIALAKEDTTKTKEDIKKLLEKKKKTKNEIRVIKQDYKKQSTDAHPVADVLLRPIIGIKRVSVNYDITRGTSIPGFLPTPNMFGQDFKAGAPGFPFLFGAQKDTSWLTQISKKGWLTEDTTFNFQFQQEVSKNLNLRMVFEPFRDFRVDISLNKRTTENYSEFFKRVSDDSGFKHLAPITNGSYSISFVMLRTVFDKLDENNFSRAFRNYESLREDYAARLAQLNPNSNDIFRNDSIVLTNFFEGYGPFAQDVLIPAFLAAYTGKDPDKVKLNPLKTIPLPNWRFTYGGFSKMEWGKKLFKTFNISHGYNSTFTISSYTSDLNFIGDPSADRDAIYFLPSQLDSLTGNFYNLYNIPQIILTEQLQPLIGVDITWNNSLITNFEYKRSRTVGMSFLDYQFSENRANEFTVGLGYVLSGLTLPIKIRGKKVALENDINFRADFSLRDDKTINYRLDQNIAEPTRGAKTIIFTPTIDYIVNKRLNIRLFYDFRKTIPATTASFPTTNARGGLLIRFNLAP
jgi:cell surface protein SprA